MAHLLLKCTEIDNEKHDGFSYYMGKGGHTVRSYDHLDPEVLRLGLEHGYSSARTAHMGCKAYMRKAERIHKNDNVHCICVSTGIHVELLKEGT